MWIAINTILWQGRRNPKMEINKNQANQIIHTLKSVIKEDINFIDPTGTIIASSDPNRVGSFHEGATIVAKNKQPLIIYEDNEYLGTKKGINLPVFLENDLVAIVGITVTGAFDEVLKLTTIVAKMSEILIKEQYLNTQKQFKRENNRIIMEMIINDEVRIDNIILKLNQLGYNPSIFSFFAVCELDHFDSTDIDLTNIVYNSIEKRIDYKDLIVKFQNRFVILSSQENYVDFVATLKNIQRHIEKKYGIGITIGISEKFEDIRQIRTAYKQAEMVIKIGVNKESRTIEQFEPSSLEFLFFGFSDLSKQSYLNAILKELNQEERKAASEIVFSYIKNNGSIMKISEELFIHKNTLQYRLNRIWKITGYNPRKIKDLIILYLALELERQA